MMDFTYYKLVDKVPVLCESMDEALEAGAWGDEARLVDYTLIDGGAVSTVFLVLDHNHTGQGDPLLFETMVFGGVYDEFQIRYATYEEAVVGHQSVLRMVKEDME